MPSRHCERSEATFGRETTVDEDLPQAMQIRRRRRRRRSSKAMSLGLELNLVLFCFLGTRGDLISRHRFQVRDNIFHHLFGFIAAQGRHRRVVANRLRI